MMCFKYGCQDRHPLRDWVKHSTMLVTVLLQKRHFVPRGRGKESHTKIRSPLLCHVHAFTTTTTKMVV